MKRAIISDVHSNQEAFEAVVVDIKSQGIEPKDIVNLGDLVGYGANPNEVIALNRKYGIPTIMGNHDAAVIDEIDYRALFNDRPVMSIDITKKLIRPEFLDYLRTLRNFYIMESGENGLNVRFVHGCPPDSYIYYFYEKSLHHIFEEMEEMAEDVCFVGHTHRLHACACNQENQIIEIEFENLKLEGGTKYLLNVGSVGQPRDRDPRAKWCLFDTSDGTLDIRRVEYDVELAAKKILDAGMPKSHAERLKRGR